MKITIELTRESDGAWIARGNHADGNYAVIYRKGPSAAAAMLAAMSALNALEPGFAEPAAYPDDPNFTGANRG